MNIYYAQNKEDLLIKAFFPDVKSGFYIDVGANDPVIDSVTKKFYDEGWHGINIDPISKHIKNLKKHRPKDINLNIGLGGKKGEARFTEYTEGNGLSTFADSMKQQYKKDTDKPTGKHKDYLVTVATLKDIVAEFKVKHIHFLKIDVEGYEYEVVSGYDWKNPRPELVCIEASHIIKDWRPIFERNGYKLVFFDGVNNYYLADESLYRQKHFNYDNAALAGPPIYYLAYLDTSKTIEKRTSELAKVKEDDLRWRIAEKDKEVSFLQQQQRDIRYLGRRLNTEIQIRLNDRAKSYRVRRSLRYQPDALIKKAAGNEDITAAEALKVAHERDRLNIKATNKVRSSYPKAFFWLAASRSYALMSKLAKKVMQL